METTSSSNITEELQYLYLKSTFYCLFEDYLLPLVSYYLVWHYSDRSGVSLPVQDDLQIYIFKV